MTRRRDVRAVEIQGDDAAWLRGQPLPDGVALAELDEVEHFGRVFDRAPGSALYVPAEDDAVDRAVGRALAMAPEPDAPIGIDLFAGCGGFSVGMHEAGVDVVAAVEWDAPATHTYLTNLGRPDAQIHFASEADRQRWEKYQRKALTASRRLRAKDGTASPCGDFDHEWIGTGYRTHTPAMLKGEHGCRAFWFGDISKVSGHALMESAGVEHVDVLFGGPPCQGLSTANSKACLEDPRNAMIWEYLRIVDEIRPTTFMIENVPAILTVATGALFNAIAQLANDAGYDVVATKLDACEFGVPQHRVRAIIVGTREDQPGYRYPMPTHWALGRPVDGKRWAMLDDFGEGRGHRRYQKELPAQARFDHETRRWSFDAAESNQAAQPSREECEQLDILGEGVV